MKLFIISVFWLLPFNTFGQLLDKQNKKGLSVTPVVAANSTYGLMIGGAAAYYVKARKLHKFLGIGITTMENQQHFFGSWDAHGNQWKHGVQVKYSSFFEAYYGDSREVRRDPPDRIARRANEIMPYGAYRVTPAFSIKGLLDYRKRHELGTLEKVDGTEEKTKIYPDDATWTIGVNLTYDIRHDSPLSPLGGYYEIKLRTMPTQAASNQETDPFSTFSLDIREAWALSGPQHHQTID